MGPEELAEQRRGRWPDVLVARSEVTLVVARQDLLETRQALREEPGGSFDVLADVTATDWPGAEPRFWMAYHLLSMRHQHRLRVKVGLPEADPHVASAT